MPIRCVVVSLVELLPGHRGRVERAARHPVAGEEPRPVLLGNAEQVADHQHRQRPGEIADHVHAAARHDLVEQRIDQRGDLRPHLLEPPGREGFCDQSTQPRVIRRIAHQHGEPQAAKHRLLEEFSALARIGELAFEIVPEARIFQHAGNVGMAR